MTQQPNIKNVNEFKLAHPKEYDRLVKKHENQEGNMKLFANADEGITASHYKAALKKDPTLDFVEFSREFNPAGRFSSLENYRNYYKSNQNVYEKGDGRLADRMYNHLTVTGEDNAVYGGKINVKDYKDFIFQQAPRFKISGSRKEGMEKKTPDPYTKNELTEFTGSLVGTEDMALPTDKMRAIQALSFKREEALKYLQEYLYNQYENAGGTLGEEDKEIVRQNKFLRKNIKTGELEFYNPKADKYQLMNSGGLDIGDIISLSGDGIKLFTETVGGAAGYLTGKAIGITAGGLAGPGSLVLSPTLGGAGALYGGYKGSYYGNLVGEITKAALGNVFFPGLNPDTSTKEGVAQIINDPNVLKDAELASYFGAAGIAAEGVVRAAVKSLQAGRLLTKKDFANLAENAEEAQLIADDINGKLVDTKLLAKGKPREFFFGVAEATADPETLLFLNALKDSDPLVRDKLAKMDKVQQKLLGTYFDEAGSSFNYANLSGKSGSDPTSVVNKIKEILYIRQNSDIGRFRDEVLKKSQKSLDDSIKELPNKGKILDKDISGSYIRTAVGDAQKALDDEFTPLFEGVMELASEQQVSVKPILKVLDDIKLRQEETAFKNFLPVEKFFKLKDGDKLDGKYLIQTMQDLKAFDRKMRTGAIAADASEANVQRLIGAIQEAFAKGNKGNKVIYQKLRNLNTDYFNRKKALNNTLGDLVAVKNGRVKIQDSDLFETSFTARTGGYKERIDEVYNVLKNNADHMNAYKKNILNFYRREVIKPDGSVDLKKHQQFISTTDKGGYGYGLRKFFGEEFDQIKKVGQLQKRVEKEAIQLENLKKDLAEQTAGKVQDLSPNSIINAMFDSQDPKMGAQIMDLLDQNPEIKNKFKTVLADRIKDGITDIKGNFNLVEFDKFFKPNKKNSTYNAFKIAFRDDKNYIDAIDTIHKAVTVMARRGDGAAKKETLSSQWMMHLLRVRVGMFTPEGRAMTAAIRLSEKANQKSFANLISNPESTKKIAKLAKMPIPKGLTDDFSINNFAKRNKLYNQVVTQLLGDLSGYDDVKTDTQDPFVIFNEKNKKPAIPKPNLREQMNLSLAPVTDPNVNLFAGTLDMPTIDDRPQQVAQTEAPAPAPVSSGIGALNPQAQAANYAGLFPEDNLGQAIANQGVRRG